MSWLILGSRKLLGDKKKPQKKPQNKQKGWNCAYLLQNKKDKNIARVLRRAQLGFDREAAKAAGSCCQALGSGLLASGCCHAPSAQWEQWPWAQPPWELPAWCNASSQGVCFLLCVLQQLWFLVAGFLSGWEREWRLFIAQLMDLKIDFLW